MSRLALEINGAGIIVTDEQRVLVEEPGYAYEENGQIVTGAAAYAQARLQPARTRSGFWSSLSVDGATSESSGELAYEHLRETWSRAGHSQAHAVFVVPGSYDPQQLGLVLGIAQECGIAVEAMVDAAVAASDLRYDERDLFYIDASLRTVSVTRIAQSDAAAVGAVEVSRDIGLAGFTDDLVRSIARVFILETRFDPLHKAATEQALFDGLPGWIEALRRDGSVQAEIDADGDPIAVELTTERVRGASLRLAREIVRLIDRLRSPNTVAVLQINDRLARLPGFSSELGRMQGVEIRALERGAPALSALQRVSPDESDHPEVRLLRRLPFAGAAEVAASHEPRSPEPARERGPEPTHVVFQGIGYRLSSDRIEIVGERTRTANGTHVIAIGDESGNAAGTHCVLEREEGVLAVVRGAQELLFVNGERVDGRRNVAVGDVVRIGDRGIELHIVSVEG